MNLNDQDYRIWKNENFVIESAITLSLWDEIIINKFSIFSIMIKKQIYICIKYSTIQ